MTDEVLWVNCPDCKATHRLRGTSEALAKRAGTSFACPKCNKPIVVPGSARMAVHVPETNPPQFTCPYCGALLTLPMQGTFQITGSVIGCLRCGNNARIPDGVYDTAKRIITQIAQAMPSVEKEAFVAQIAALQDILESQKAQVGGGAIRTAIQEEAPDLAEFMEPVLGLSGPEWISFIKVFVVALAAIVAFVSNPGLVTASGGFAALVKTAFDEIDKVEKAKGERARKAKLQSKAVGRPGRNAPCPCGSGKKYKKCHGG